MGRDTNKLRITELERKVSDIERALGTDDIGVSNIHYLVLNIKQLRTKIDEDRKETLQIRQSAIVLEKFIRETDQWDDFVSWLDEKNKEAEEKQKAKEEEVQQDIEMAQGEAEAAAMALEQEKMEQEIGETVQKEHMEGSEDE